ncbi:hypothetical protein QTP88_026720 [Uroleucon formosanum]
MKWGITSGLFAPLSDLLYPSDAPAQWIKAFRTRQGRGQYQYFPMALTDDAVFEVNKPATKAGNFHNGHHVMSGSIEGVGPGYMARGAPSKGSREQPKFFLRFIQRRLYRVVYKLWSERDSDRQSD